MIKFTQIRTLHIVYSLSRPYLPPISPLSGPQWPLRFGTLFIFAWTFAVPTIFMIASSSSYHLRRPRASRLGDAVVNVACAARRREAFGAKSGV